MFDFEDPYWAGAVALLIGLWIVGIALPIRLAAPAASLTQHFVEMEEDPQSDLPPPSPPPSLLWPLLVFLLSLGLMALSLWKRQAEPEGGNRWLWMACAAGLTTLWGLVLVLVTLRLR